MPEDDARVIITCEQCQTRFKVGDDKLAHGPIRVRCSKCNHVFLAGAPSGSPGPQTLPFTSAPPTAAPRPVTGFHPALATGAPSSTTLPGSLPATPRSGIFKPTPIPMAPSAGSPGSDPFGSLPLTSPVNGTGSASGPSSPASSSSSGTPSPFAVRAATPAPAADPFRTPGTDPFAPRGTPDPFASRPTPGATADPFARRPTPGAAFGGLAGQGDATSADPFAARGTPPRSTPRTPTKDPFAGLGPAAPPPAARSGTTDPFATLPVPSSAPSTPSFSSASAVPMADPFSTPAPIAPGPPPFAASAEVVFGGDVGDPFATDDGPAGDTETAATAVNPVLGGRAASPAPASPFAAATVRTHDPFATAEQPSGELTSIESEESLSGSATGPLAVRSPAPLPQSSAPFEDELDPFGSLDDAPAPSRLPPPPPPPTQPRVQLPRAPTPAAAVADAPAGPSSLRPAGDTGKYVPPGPDGAKQRRRETVQRLKELGWSTGQGLLFVVFVIVAVVLGRGGSLDDVLRGDVRGALGGARVVGELAVEDAQVTRRTLRSGLEVVVVTGVVKNTTDKTLPGALVEVRFSAARASAAASAPLVGWAWSAVDGVDVDEVLTGPDAAVLSVRAPPSASVAPYSRAPFVVVGKAPAEGARATYQVKITAPPPAMATFIPAASTSAGP